MMGGPVRQLGELLRQEVELLGLGQCDDLRALLLKKLELLQLLREDPGQLDRAELVSVWRQNRWLLQTLRPHAGDRIPSAQALRQAGWRG